MKKNFLKTFGFQISKQRIVLSFLFFLFLLAIGQQLYQLYLIFKKERFVDFYVYFEAARFALEGGNFYQKLYFGDTPFNYPPTALLLLGIFTLFSKSRGSLIFLFSSLMSLLGSIYLLIKLQFKKAERASFFLLASIFFIQFFPTKFTLTLGQINLVILFLVTLSFYAFKKGKDAIAGVFLSLASLIKIFPIFLALFYLKEKRKKAIVAFLATSILGILGAVALLQSSSIVNYVHFVGKNLFLRAGSVSYFDQSLNSFLLRLNMADNCRLFLRLISSVFLAIFFLKAKDKALSFFALVAVVTIILPGFVWFHHYVILIPLMILLFAKIYKKRLLWPKVALLIGYLACSLHIRSPQAWVGPNILLFSHPFLGAIILFSLALHEDRAQKLL